MVVLQILLSFIWMCILPFLTGCLFLPLFQKEKEGLRTMAFAAGLMLHYCVYEGFLLIGMKLDFGMRRVTLLYAICAVLSAAAGAFSLLKRRNALAPLRLPSLRERPLFYLAAALILLQIGAELFLSTPDLDDAFYSGISSMSIARDTLLTTDAYNGIMVKGISKRYIISGLPVYQAALSLLSARLHHLFIQHNLFPAFYIPLSYCLFYRVGRWLFPKEEESGDRLLLFLAVLHLFGNYYVFSPENFLVTRLWQGKALFVAIGIPFLFLAGQKAIRLTADRASLIARAAAWFLTACVLISCTFMGETGLYLAPFMLAAMTAGACITDRKLRPLAPAALVCLPEAVLLYYLFMRM